MFTFMNVCGVHGPHAPTPRAATVLTHNQKITQFHVDIFISDFIWMKDENVFWEKICPYTSDLDFRQQVQHLPIDFRWQVLSNQLFTMFFSQYRQCVVIFVNDDHVFAAAVLDGE